MCCYRRDLTRSGRANCRYLRGSDCLRRESGVSDRHGRALRAGRSFNGGIELLRKRLDDASPESSLWLSKDTVRLADPIVSDRKLPIRSIDIICDDYPTIDFIGGERMLQSIHNKFGHDQAKTLGLTRSRTASFASYFHRNWPVANHRRREGVAQP